MRKHIAVVMAVIMALSICGCGSSKSLFPENTGEQQETKTADSGSMKVGYLLLHLADSLYSRNGIWCISEIGRAHV